MPAPLTLSPKAAGQIKASLAKQGQPGGALRLKVVAGGCSGMSYEFEFVAEPRPGDVLAETDGARLAVEPKSLFFLMGSTVDYVSTLLHSGFEVRNPKAASTCNCGTSFST